jgi:hypothetical protein
MATIKRVTTPTKLAPDGTPIIAPNFTVPKTNNVRNLRPRCGLGQFPASQTGLYYSNAYYQYGDHFMELPGAQCSIHTDYFDQYGNKTGEFNGGPYWYVPGPGSYYYGGKNNINPVPNKKTSYGWTDLKRGLINLLTNTFDAPNQYAGNTYFNIAHAGTPSSTEGTSAEAAYNRGEFGRVGSIQAKVELDLIKGYVAKELFIGAAMQDGSVQRFMSDTKTENNNLLAPNRITQSFLNFDVENTNRFLSKVADFVYQYSEAWNEKGSFVKNAIHETASLNRQNFGMEQTTPPQWLQGKTFSDTLPNGSTVSFTFNSTGYTRTVTPP